MIENFYENCDLLYSVHFSEHNYSVSTSDVLLVREKVNYELATEQIALLASYNLIEIHFSI